MSRESRRRDLESDLAALENRFAEDLRGALRRCAGGEWGLFGQNDEALKAHFRNNAGGYLSASAQRLNAMAAEIAATRARLGYTEPNALCTRYAAYRARRGSNALGEPQLALEFLAELEGTASNSRS
jgi:hypothetical protein